MKVIDSDNYSASGIETFFFPGGEPHARIPEDFGDALLFLKARTWNDVGIALVVLDALASQGYEVNLFAPYFPGARQDRSDKQTPITATLLIDMFRMVTTNIYTFDVHSVVVGSEVTKNFMPSDFVLDPSSFNAASIIVPDEGAKKRCESFDLMYGRYFPMIQCEKHRDFATGKFIGFKMPPLPRIGNYLIVDDICDGGGTFNLLAEEFLKDPFGKESNLELWVSHGIFSKGVQNIHPKISKIYTTDSWFNWSKRDDRELLNLDDGDGRLKVISLQPIIDLILQENVDEV